MKKALLLFLAVFLAAVLAVGARAEASPRKLTLMIYLCGSNLESNYGSASKDLEEMQKAEFDFSQISLLVMQGGSSKWGSQPVTDGQTIIKELGKAPGGKKTGFRPIGSDSAPRNMGDPETLAYFIRFGMEKYPAQDYALILWDHGEGPLGTICMDEMYQLDGLTLDELSQALERAELPKKLSWIGFDACLMSSVEVAIAMSPYAEYMIASQETEPKGGWNYQFLTGIEKDADGAETGKRIIDTYFSGEDGDEIGNTLSCVNLSKVEKLSVEMDQFFGAIGRSMNESNFAFLSGLRTSSAEFGRAVKSIASKDFDLVDLGDLIDHYQELGDIRSINEALKQAVVKSYTNRKDRVSGLSVYHPMYNDADYLSSWKDAYDNLEIGKGYKAYLNAFGTILTGKTLADWNGLVLSDDGFSETKENCYSLGLTEDQLEHMASAQLLILGSLSTAYQMETYDLQLSQTGAGMQGKEVYYYPVWSSEMEPGEDGQLRGRFGGRSLYLVDETGKAVAGPIGYRLSDDGREWYIHMVYKDLSAQDEQNPTADVMLTCELDEATGMLTVITSAVYDPATETYTRRISFSEEDYTDLYIDRLARALPKDTELLPGFENWEEKDSSIAISLPLKWGLRVIDEQLSGTPLYATVQVTDVQQRTYCTPLVRVQNPNLLDIGIFPRTYTGKDFELTLYAVMDNSQLTPGLSISMEVKNLSSIEKSYYFYNCVANGRRTLYGSLYVKAEPGGTGYDVMHIDPVQLLGIEEITKLDIQLSEWYESGTYLDIRTPVSFSVSGCKNAYAGEAEGLEPIAFWKAERADWELLSIEKELSGDLSILLHITNHDTKLTVFPSPDYAVINDSLQIKLPLANISLVEPQTDVYARFTIPDSVMLSSYDLKISGRAGNRSLGIYHLLENWNIDEINRITLLKEWSDGLETIDFQLESPVRVGEKQERTRVEKWDGLLLDGEVTVRVERVLVGNNGFAFRLEMTNHADRPIQFEINNMQANGRDYDQTYSSEFKTYTLYAGASMTVCEEILYRAGELNDFSMTFRYDDFTSRRAYVRFPSPVTYWQAGGAYPDDYVTEPVPHSRMAAVEYRPARIETEAGNVKLAMRLTNSLLVNRKPGEAENYSVQMHLALILTDQPRQNMSCSFDQFVVNGHIALNGKAEKPSEDGVYTVTLDRMEQLTNVREITSIQCMMHTVAPDGTLREIPLQWEISHCDLTGNVPTIDGAPLASMADKGIVWELLSLTVNESDELKYNEYKGRINAILRVQNASDQVYELNGAYVLINDFCTGGINVRIEPEMEAYVVCDLNNGVVYDKWYEVNGSTMVNICFFEGCLLQSSGMDVLTQVEIQAEANSVGGAAPEPILLTLETPVQLPAADVSQKAEAYKQRCFLLDDRISVSLIYNYRIDGGLLLVFAFENHDEVFHTLTLRDPAMAQHWASFDNRYEEEKSYTLPAHSIRVEAVRLQFLEAVDDYTPSNAVRLTLCDEAETFGTASFWADFTSLASGRMLAGSMFHCIQAGEDKEIREDEPYDLNSYQLIAVVRDIYTNDIKEWSQGLYLDQLNEDQAFEPALKILNQTSAVKTYQIRAEVNGISYQWNPFDVDPQMDIFAYLIGAIDEAGDYACAFYDGGRMVCKGTLTVFNHSGEEAEAAREEKTPEAVVYGDGTVYSGGMSEDGRRNGLGRMTYSSGEMYAGGWSGNRKNGIGQYWFADHTKKHPHWYLGTWVNGIRQGFGVMTYANGDVYIGQWDQDQKSGFGLQLSSGGDVYLGQWSRGKQNGLGTIRTGAPSGSQWKQYTGEWENGKWSGEGTAVAANGAKYEGHWKYGKRHGEGVMVYASGNRYAGSWAQDSQNGFGTMDYIGGDVYNGMWRNGLFHGKGTYLSAADPSESLEGQWAYGAPVRTAEEIEAFFGGGFAAADVVPPASAVPPADGEPAEDGGEETERPAGQIYSENGLTYEIFDDYVRVVSCEKDVQSARVPAKIQGLPVTAIGEKAFQDCNQLCSVTLPDTLLQIDAYAFSGADSLTEIVIPESVEIIGRYAFSYCDSLESAVAGGKNTVIGDNAFVSCKKLREVTLLDGITAIGNEAFRSCEALETLILPASVSYINGNPARGCKRFMSFHIVSGNPYYWTIDGVLYSAAAKELLAYPIGREAESFEAPEGVTGIGKSAFYYSDHLQSVILNRGVSHLDDSAFSFCTKLRAVSLPEGLKSIGEDAFYYCRSLTAARLPEGCEEIGEDAFHDCSSLVGVYLPDSLLSIGKAAFYACSSLERVNPPASLLSIGEEAFYRCERLAEIEIPRQVKTIGDYAFRYCKKLTEIRVAPENARYQVADGALIDLESRTLLYYPAGRTGDVCTIPESVAGIAPYAFDSSKLTAIVIPDSVTRLGNNAFSSCERLAEIRLPANLTVIPDAAFDSCKLLTEIVVPHGVTEIGSKAFSGCSALKTVSLPDTLTSLGDSAFDYCRNLTEIIVPPENTHFRFMDGALIDLESHTLLCYPAGRTEETFTVPESVTAIAPDAFSSCSLTAIIIPDSVTQIGKNAFSLCGKLTEIRLPSSLEAIPSMAFYHCDALKEIVVPQSVTSIGSSAFSNCASLTHVSLPDSLASIGRSAFEKCILLEDITLPDSLTEISDKLCYECDSLKSIAVPHGVTSIGSSAFSFCDQLRDIYLPDTLASIGNYVFTYDKLENIYYEGTESQWQSIAIGKDNDELTRAVLWPEWGP